MAALPTHQVALSATDLRLGMPKQAPPGRLLSPKSLHLPLVFCLPHLQLPRDTAAEEK